MYCGLDIASTYPTIGADEDSAVPLARKVVFYEAELKHTKQHKLCGGPESRMNPHAKQTHIPDNRYTLVDQNIFRKRFPSMGVLMHFQKKDNGTISLTGTSTAQYGQNFLGYTAAHCLDNKQVC